MHLGANYARRDEPALADESLQKPASLPRPLVRTRWRALCLLALALASLTGSAERLPLRLYTTADGLRSGFIHHMMRDSHGFIWLCTRDGLSRFDGYRFTNYKMERGPWWLHLLNMPPRESFL